MLSISFISNDLKSQQICERKIDATVTSEMFRFKIRLSYSANFKHAIRALCLPFLLIIRDGKTNFYGNKCNTRFNGGARVTGEVKV